MPLDSILPSPDTALAPALLQTVAESLYPINDILAILCDLPDKKGEQYFVELNVGRHFRHVYDHFNAVFAGSGSGVVDYNHRQRESDVERDMGLSQSSLEKIIAACLGLDGAYLSNTIEVISEVSCSTEKSYRFTSNIERELLYLINHTVHHLAYVKLLLKGADIALPETIGIAPSTATYLRATTCA